MKGYLLLLFLFIPLYGFGECKTFFNTVPQGVMCLHCMHRKANGGVSALTDSLVNACIKNIAIGFLTDGSFGFDKSVIESEVIKLSQEGRKVFLHLYIVNGPGQRRWKLGAFKSFAIMNPVEFRGEIRRNIKLRREYAEQVKRLIPVISLTVSLGGVVYLAPALEDNLDDASFKTISNLTLRALPKTLPFTLVRNPCSDCYGGNTTGLPNGVIREHHTSKFDFSLQDGVISNDGKYFVFPNGTSSSGSGSSAMPSYTFSDLRNVRDRARRQNDIFLLWIGKYQGSRLGMELQPVNQRNFEFPSAYEVREITDFLSK